MLCCVCVVVDGRDDRHDGVALDRGRRLYYRSGMISVLIRSTVSFVRTDIYCLLGVQEGGDTPHLHNFNTFINDNTDY